MNRCLNCGLPGHKTDVCPRYGPRYPAPGKTAEDYEQDYQRIMNLIARDIVAEHDAEHEDAIEVAAQVTPPKHYVSLGVVELEARKHVCDSCNAPAGQPCLSRNGLETKAHANRVKKAEDEIARSLQGSPGT